MFKKVGIYTGVIIGVAAGAFAKNKYFDLYMILNDGKEISGKDVNKHIEIHNSLNSRKIELNKFINRCALHYNFRYNNFRYKNGKNVDCIEFDPTRHCRRGGFYFTTNEHVGEYASYGSQLCNIELDDDARVYVETAKMKADKVNISGIIPCHKESYHIVDCLHEKCLLEKHDCGDVKCPCSVSNILIEILLNM